MPDFSMPRWLTEQHSFADSLLKGAQVGAIIANNRYRNQALAAQAIDAERNYALREKALTVDQEQKDIMIKSKLLEMETNKQMLADQVSDKETLSSWIAERNQLSPEERLNMSIPSLRLPASFNAANQIYDNDRMAYQQSVAGKAQTALALRLGKIDADYVQQYIDEPDPARKREILATGEAAATAKAEALRAVAPTIAAESREATAKIKADSQENIARFKQQATVDKSQGVGEAQFVNRHLNTVLSQLAEDNDYLDKSVEIRTDAATKLLQKAYRESGIGNSASPTATAPTPSAKVALANKLASEHPDWDRARIISEVNKQLP